MNLLQIILIGLQMVLVWTKTVENFSDNIKSDEPPPEGIYAFLELKNSEPPNVRSPPYKYVKERCINDPNPLKSMHNFCGDLNTGRIPINPMNPEDKYPFELIRDKTLEKIGKALPVLKSDDLPRVKEIINGASNPDAAAASAGELHAAANQAVNDDIQNELKKRNDDFVTYQHANQQYHAAESYASRRQSRACEGGGVLCYLTNMFQGATGSSSGSSVPHYSSKSSVHHRKDEFHPQSSISPMTRFGDGPPTPCLSKIHYATPSYAKNYQGIWRYIVQIPYEGYYTQVVEVTYCQNKRSYHLEGYCLSTPRWERLLAAEKFYPNVNDAEAAAAAAAAAASSGPAAGLSSTFNIPPTLLNSTLNNVGADRTNGTSGIECDGYDSHGCFQIRIFQDWFLVPSTCKVWRPDFYKRHVATTAY